MVGGIDKPSSTASLFKSLYFKSNVAWALLLLWNVSSLCLCLCWWPCECEWLWRPPQTPSPCKIIAMLCVGWEIFEFIMMVTKTKNFSRLAWEGGWPRSTAYLHYINEHPDGWHNHHSIGIDIKVLVEQSIGCEEQQKRCQYPDSENRHYRT